MKGFFSVIIAFFALGQIFSQIDDKEAVLKKKAEGTGDSSKTWKAGGVFNANTTQVALSNWAGGGQNSISVQGILGLYANHAKGKLAWDNNLDLAYGVVKQGSLDWFKNDDRIELNSKFGYQASSKWYYAGLLNFRTQFVEGFNNPGEINYISNFLAPGYTTIALGMDYKPNDRLTMFISPATIKVTIVTDELLSSQGAFGVLPGQKVRAEFGGYLKAMFQQKKLFGNENLSFKTNVSLFTNYANKPQNIDVTADAIFTAKVAKYLSVSLSAFLIYDDDINIKLYDDNNVEIGEGPRTQFKEVLALGFAYKF
jgi:hypothetical protein